MATINSVTNGGKYHFDDPNAWSGGVVPGKGDVAVIQHTFTRINSGSGYHYWNGVKNRIVVDTIQWNGLAKKNGMEMGDIISELKIENLIIVIYYYIIRFLM